MSMSLDPLYKAAMFSLVLSYGMYFQIQTLSSFFPSSLLLPLESEAFATVQNEPCSFNLLAMANNFTRLYVLR